MTTEADQFQIIELLQTQIDGLLTEQNDLERRLVKLTKDYAKLETRCAQLQQLRDRLQADYDLLQREVVALRIQRDELRTQNAQLRALHKSASADSRQRDKRRR
jgi:FtsZ-binding cell division protein ZapB